MYVFETVWTAYWVMGCSLNSLVCWGFLKLLLYRIQHWFASQYVIKVQRAEKWGRKKQLNVACGNGIDLFDRLGFSGGLKTWEEKKCVLAFNFTGIKSNYFCTFLCIKVGLSHVFLLSLTASAFAATFAIEHLNILKLKFPKVRYGWEKKTSKYNLTYSLHLFRILFLYVSCSGN